MNLMNMLTSALTSGAALEALSAKTGLSQKQLKLIIAIAIPIATIIIRKRILTKRGGSSEKE